MRDWPLLVRLGILAVFIGLGAAWIGLNRTLGRDPCIRTGDGTNSGACDPVAGLFTASVIAGVVVAALLLAASLRRAR